MIYISFKYGLHSTQPLPSIFGTLDILLISSAAGIIQSFLKKSIISLIPGPVPVFSFASIITKLIGGTSNFGAGISLFTSRKISTPSGQQAKQRYYVE